MGKMILLFCVCLCLLVIQSCDNQAKFYYCTTGNVDIFSKKMSPVDLNDAQSKLYKIATVSKGVKLEVVGTSYGKDYMINKVKTPQGLKGYVVFSGAYLDDCK